LRREDKARRGLPEPAWPMRRVTERVSACIMCR